MEAESTYARIEKFMATSLLELVASYERDGRHASGKWAKDLSARVEELPNGEGFNIKILGSEHTQWMENGRRPSAKFPPMEAIKQWINDKQSLQGKFKDINENSLAFLIARKIKNEGYKGKPTVSSVLTEEWTQKLLEAIGWGWTVQFQSDIIKILREK